MASQDNIQIVRSAFDAFNRRDMDSLLNLYSDQVDWHLAPFDKHMKGKEGIRQFMQSWLTPFPDAKIEVLNVIAAGEYVTAEYIGRGTHSGLLIVPGIPTPFQASQRKLEIRFCDVTHLKDGKFVSGRSYYDVATIYRQLGLERQLQQQKAA